MSSIEDLGPNSRRLFDRLEFGLVEYGDEFRWISSLRATKEDFLKHTLITDFDGFIYGFSDSTNYTEVNYNAVPPEKVALLHFNAWLEFLLGKIGL